jgi:hypothetical protein
MIVNADLVPVALRDEVFHEHHQSRWKDVMLDLHRSHQRTRLTNVLDEMINIHFGLPSLQCVVCGIVDGEC